MNKKISLLLISAFVFSIIFSTFSAVPVAKAGEMNTAQLIELLINLGVIAPDKAAAARSIFSSTATSSKAYLQVLAPNGGESWEIDLDIPYIIKWGSQGLSTVNVSLVPSSKGNICNLTATPVSSKDGNHELSVLLKTAKCYNSTTATSTKLLDGTYRVRVSGVDALGLAVKDESNATFKITPVPIPSLKVTYPNGGETLIRNHEYTVKYSLKNVTKVQDNLIYLSLLDNEGNVVFNSHKIKRNDGTYSFDVPGSLSIGAYKMQLKTTTSPNKIEIEDSTDSPFWISSAI